MKTFKILVLAISCLLFTQQLIADVTLSSSPVNPANVSQSSNDNIVYIVKMDVATSSVTVNNIIFNLGGTYGATDLVSLNIYYNPSGPSLSGASIMANNVSAAFAAPHTFNTSFTYAGSQTVSAGTTGYFIITFNTTATATNGNTIKINGATDPVSFTFTTPPTVINNQTDAAGTQTIQVATIMLSSTTVAAGNVAQGTNTNMLYIIKMEVTDLPVMVSHIHFTLSGTHDNNDLTFLNVYMNPTTPSLSGASLIANNIIATFAAGHTYDAAFNYSGPQNISAGSSCYFLITFNTNPSATDANTVKLNGATNPVSFTYTTSPTLINNQTDAGGTQTILASVLTLSTNTVSAANVAQGSTNNIVYTAKMDVAVFPVIISHVIFTLGGTHDNNDLVTLSVYLNPASPTLSGALLLCNNIPATFAAGHTYDAFFLNSGPQTLPDGASYYIIITFNASGSATLGNTVKLNGATDPISFTYATSPTIINNQTDDAGPQTFASILPLRLTNFSGNLENNQEVKLQWTTEFEMNTKYFEIEWSDDAQQFISIGIESVSNLYSQRKSYSYLHKGPAQGNNFYRLKMIDRDGYYTYSPIIKVYAGVIKTKFIVSPNPANKELHLTFQYATSETIILNLYNENGVIISSKAVFARKGSNELRWNIEHLNPGEYFISYDHTKIEPSKFIKY